VDPLPELLAAVEKFSQLKDTGEKVSDFMAQGELMGPSLTPEARAILTFLDANARSARAMSDMIAGMYRALENAGNPKEGDIFGTAVVPSMGQIVEAGIRDASAPGALMGNLFDAPDAFPGRAGAPRSPSSALQEADSHIDQAKTDGPLHQTAADCGKKAA